MIFIENTARSPRLSEREDIGDRRHRFSSLVLSHPDPIDFRLDPGPMLGEDSRLRCAPPSPTSFMVLSWLCAL